MITSLLSVMSVLLVGEPTGATAASQQPDRPASGEIVTDLDPVEFTIDPRAFFDELVNRYRDLAVYRDVTRVVQITQHHDDDVPKRIETEVSSDITDESVTIGTPGSQLRRLLGLSLPFKLSEEVESIQYRYERWLLPHLSLRLADEPLRDFREGVSEGFTATEAATVTVDNRSMVHLELKSGDGLSEDSNARFDLYVDPESMLVERIHGEQRLPDGGRYETELQIEPRHVEARTPKPADKPEKPKPTYTAYEPSFAVQQAWDEPDETAHPPVDVPSQPASPIAGGGDQSGQGEEQSEHAASEPSSGGNDVPTRSREPSSGDAPSSGGSSGSSSSGSSGSEDDTKSDPPSKPQGRPLY